MTRADHIAEVSGWPEGTCRDCDAPFPKRNGYERQCPICYKEGRSYKVLWGDQAFLWAQGQIVQLRHQRRAPCPQRRLARDLDLPRLLLGVVALVLPRAPRRRAGRRARDPFRQPQRVHVHTGLRDGHAPARRGRVHSR